MLLDKTDKQGKQRKSFMLKILSNVVLHCRKGRKQSLSLQGWMPFSHDLPQYSSRCVLESGWKKDQHVSCIESDHPSLSLLISQILEHSGEVRYCARSRNPTGNNTHLCFGRGRGGRRVGDIKKAYAVRR